MLDPKAILTDPDRAIAQWTRLGLDGAAIVAELTAEDQVRKQAIRAHDEAKRQQTELSGVFRDKSASGEAKAAAREQLKPLSDTIKNEGANMKAATDRIRQKLMALDNFAHDSVPDGSTEADNQLSHTWGEPRQFDFEPRDHVELGEALDILDFEAAARISGSGFAVYRGLGARLERALASFMLDLHTTEHGYTEVYTPYLVVRHTMEGTGQLPKFEDDAFKTEDDRFLIPTSEVSVTNLHRGQLLEPGELPKHYTAYSSCFRREAGSYGKDTRGLTRVHQFQKVEMIKIVPPEASYDELDAMVGNAEAVLQKLELPYRVVTLCTGDLGFAATKTFDVEVWLPSNGGGWREISSCSNCEDFQARRADIRYRPAKGEKPRFAHTLNGSGLAIGRTIIALLENGQQADGSVKIPTALQPYMGGIEVIAAPA